MRRWGSATTAGRDVLEGGQRHPADGYAVLQGRLTDTEMWQVSQLVANADKPLPPAAVAILRGEQPAPAPAASAPEKK